MSKKNSFLLMFYIIFLSACNESNSVSETPPEKPIKVTSISSQDLVSIDRCQEGTSVKNNLMDVIGDGHLLYPNPKNTSPAIINNKATNAFGRTIFQSIDSSEVVKIKCEKKDWVLVQIIKPDWLTDVEGWTKRQHLKPKQVLKGEPTKANDSKINLSNRFTEGSTSINLSKADLAWHALNTYGFNCTEVIRKGSMNNKGYYVIKCSSGLELRVVPRNGMHPSITINK